MSDNKKQKECTVKQVEYCRWYIIFGDNNSAACRKTGIARNTGIAWKELPQVQEELKTQRAQLIGQLSNEAVERAMDRGDRYSHILLIFMLKAMDPKKFDEGCRKQYIANEGMKEAFENLKAPILQEVGITEGDRPPTREEFLEQFGNTRETVN